ncbi:LuxR C-terminal-related transcriptional regulator [Saccharomonospora sp. NPDC046836]|uniref:helix-turn-helix transcriptional regulator n=1 Tax=Saccharomonospora sp. NPDC046836 TaxID=3156921 RepID=UPI0033DC6313
MSMTWPGSVPLAGTVEAEQRLGYLGSDPVHGAFIRAVCHADRRLRWIDSMPRESRPLLAQWCADLVVVDLDVPDAPAACAAVRAASSRTVLLTLLCREHPVDLEGWAGLRELVDGVISCHCGEPEMVGILPVSDQVVRAIETARHRQQRIHADVLGPIEKAVLECAAAGLTAELTARELRLEAAEVRALMVKIRKRLGARSRANAVAIALRAGWIS